MSYLNVIKTRSFNWEDWRLAKRPISYNKENPGH